MAVNTVVHIYTKDAQGIQGYTERVTFGITPAAFGATTLPTAAHIEALISAIFGAGVGFISTQIITAYSVEVIEEAPTGTALGGDGSVATAIAAKSRNDIGAAADLDGWELRIPGLNKANMVYDPTNSNSIITVADPWATARTAAAVLGYRDPTGVISGATPTANIFQSAIVFNGKRSPKRPR